MKNKKEDEKFSTQMAWAILLTVVVIGLISLTNIYSKSNSGMQNSANPTQINTNQSPQNTTDNINTAPVVPVQHPSLSNMVSEWRWSTAYIGCYWTSKGGAYYKSDSGSGISVMLNSVPTIITNKHVVDDPTYGIANECDIKFPDDSGYYHYTKNVSTVPDKGNLTIDSSGNDVAYISDIDSTWNVPDGTLPVTPIKGRSRSGNYLCKSPLSIGDPIFILGYPVNGTPIESVFSPVEVTATEGIISGMDGIYYTTSAKVDSGNSGGLAIDENNDCYFGIPTWDELGNFGSLGRILPASLWLSY